MEIPTDDSLPSCVGAEERKHPRGGGGGDAAQQQRPELGGCCGSDTSAFPGSSERMKGAETGAAFSTCR